MGFVINHAPASIAMSLAQQAGQGDRVMREAQLREQQLRQQMALQDQAQRQRAFEITTALDQRRLQSDDLRYQDQRQQQAFQNDLSSKRFGLDTSQFEYGKQNDAARQQQMVAEMAERARQHDEELQFSRNKQDQVDWYNREKAGQGWQRVGQGDRRLDQQQTYSQGLLEQGRQKQDLAQKNYVQRDTQFDRSQDLREQQWREGEAGRVSGQLKRIMTDPTYGSPKPLPGMEELAKRLTQRLMELEGYEQPAPQQQAPAQGMPSPAGGMPAPMGQQQPAAPQPTPSPFPAGTQVQAGNRVIRITGVVHQQVSEKMGDGDIVMHGGIPHLYNAATNQLQPISQE